MGSTYAVFWRKAWDNLGHVIVFNFIWFTLAIPFFLAFLLAVRTMFPSEPPALPHEPPAPEARLPIPTAPPAEPGVRAESIESATAPSESAAAAPAETGESPPVPPSGETPEPPAAPAPSHKVRFHFGADAVAALVFLAMSWALLSAATGLVFYGMADITTEYDFSGYRFIFRQFLRRGPILRSVALVTIFFVTFFASWANIAFYLYLAMAKGMVFLLLAGVMLWFVLFLTMTFALALPIMAQRDLRIAYESEAFPDAAEEQRAARGPRTGLWPALRTGAVIALSFPGRTFFLTLTGFFIFLLGVLSTAGVGFFAISAPAVLFNADVKGHLQNAALGPSAQDQESPPDVP